MANTPIRMGINHTPNSIEAKKNAHKDFANSFILQKFKSNIYFFLGANLASLYAGFLHSSE